MSTLSLPGVMWREQAMDQASLYQVRCFVILLCKLGGSIVTSLYLFRAISKI